MGSFVKFHFASRLDKQKCMAAADEVLKAQTGDETEKSWMAIEPGQYL
jgi:hypothetical protein